MADPQVPNTRRALDGVSRIALLDTLRRSRQPMTVKQLADEVGLHSNTVRFHLSRLTREGIVKEESAGPNGRGRPKLVYSAVPEKEEAPFNGYQLLAEILAGQLAATSPSPAQEALAAGQEWGRHLTERPGPFASISADTALERLVVLLDDLGFAPETGEDGAPLRLHSCPFRTVADQRPDVACSVHLGLMRGALTEMGAPVEATALEPSFTSRPCLALFDVTETPKRAAARTSLTGRQAAEPGTD